MNNLNQILIEGKLTANPELKYSDKGTAICTFIVESKRFYKEGDAIEEEVSYFDITSWTELAQNCASELRSGRGVRVIGRLKQDRWQDPDGTEHSRVHIVADHVIFKFEEKK